jgi:hypothetical protein
MQSSRVIMEDNWNMNLSAMICEFYLRRACRQAGQSARNI